MKLSLAKVKKSISFENNFLLVVILVIWILFSLPAFFFYISNEESGTGWIVSINKFVQLLDQTCISNTTRNSSTDEIESCGTLSGKKVRYKVNFLVLIKTQYLNGGYQFSVGIHQMLGSIEACIHPQVLNLH